MPTISPALSETQLTESPTFASLDLAGHTVLVVDDVMYRGHSMLRAVEYLACKQPEEIRTVVLVDRGASKLPVRTDIVGVRLDVAPSDVIECNVPPYETASGSTCCSRIDALRVPLRDARYGDRSCSQSG